MTSPGHKIIACNCRLLPVTRFWFGMLNYYFFWQSQLETVEQFVTTAKGERDSLSESLLIVIRYTFL